MLYAYVHLAGGLGNQLFQYAAGYLHTRYTNAHLIFTYAENPHDHIDYRNVFSLRKQSTNVPLHTLMCCQESTFSRWHILNYSSVYLHGCFQNYWMLQSILPDFRIIIRNKLVTQRNNMRLKYDIPIMSGFIHIRRGDYLNNNSHEVQPLDYYVNALKYLPNILNWFIFSDDIDWAKTQTLFQNLDPVFVEETDPINTLALMCEINDAAIIVNSTFGWWGAYLGVGKSNVIYPKMWDNETPDLFPKKWLGI